MGEAAVAAARAVSYRNAGTIEFLVDGAGEAARFYFLEVNTRLQVEHPVTEAVTGIDLVRAQLAIAAGGSLPWTQSELAARACNRMPCTRRSRSRLPASGGHAARARNRPAPASASIPGVTEADRVDVHYDPLLSKVIVSAETRDAAIARATNALAAYPVLGIRTNIPFLIRLLAHPAVRAGMTHIAFVESHLPELVRADPAPPEALAAAAVASAMEHAPHGAPQVPTVVDPWSTMRRWGRNG
jgi:acetyl/propionyl-CoA carboxylase alpha subunit